MQLRLGAKLSIGYSTFITVLIISAIIFFTSLKGVLKRFDRVISRDSIALSKAQELQKNVIDLETGQRGFLLAGKVEFLRPYQEARSNIERTLGELKELYADDSATIFEIVNLEEAIARWQSESAIPEINKRKEINEAAISKKQLEALISDETGKRFFDQLRGYLTQLEKHFITHNKDDERILTLLILQGMINAETGLRGFLLSGKDTFLKPYNEGLFEFEQNISKLQKKTGHDKKANQLMAQASSIAESWRSEAAEPFIKAKVEIQRNPTSIEDIAEIVASAHGKQLMDGMRVKFDVFIKKLESLRDEQLDLAESQAFYAQILTFGIIIFGLLFAILVTFLIVKSITEPVRALILGTQKIAKGNLNSKVKVTTQDEIGELTKSFNNMTGDLRSSRDEITTAKDYVDNIIKSMIDTLIALTPDGKIQTINQATLDLLGYKEEELIGQPFSTIIAEEEEEEEEEEEALIGIRLKTFIKEGSLRDFAMTYKTKAGEKIPMSFSGSVMRDQQDKIVGMVGIAKDMREYKRLMGKAKKAAAAAAAAKTEAKKSAELEKANTLLKTTQAQLVQAGKLTAVGQFVAGIAHELNNPLSGCLMKAQLAMRQLSPSESKVHGKLKTIETELIRSTKLVRDLLTFSRPKKEEEKFIDINVCEVFDKAIALSEGELKNERVEIIKTYDQHIPIVSGSADRLQQVFLNLLSNAKDAIEERNQKENTRGGSVKVSAKADGAFVHIYCEDTGCGIKQEDMSKLFNPFHTTKETGKGTGLGLAVSYSIVQAHEGDIEVKSEPGKGSTFIIKLPIKQVERKAA